VHALVGGWDSVDQKSNEHFTIAVDGTARDDSGGTSIVITNANCDNCCWHNGTATISTDGHHITNLVARASASLGCAITGSGQVREKTVGHAHDQLVVYEIHWTVQRNNTHGHWPVMEHSPSALHASTIPLQDRVN
jgi:hypothetical protein